MTQAAASRTDSSAPKGLKALRPSRLQDPLLDAPASTVPIRIYY